MYHYAPSNTSLCWWSHTTRTVMMYGGAVVVLVRNTSLGEEAKEMCEVTMGHSPFEMMIRGCMHHQVYYLSHKTDSVGDGYEW